MGRYKRETLENKTVAELRGICINQGIVGMSKQRKDVVIDSIMTKLGTSSSSSKSRRKTVSATKTPKSRAGRRAFRPEIPSTGPAPTRR